MDKVVALLVDERRGAFLVAFQLLQKAQKARSAALDLQIVAFEEDSVDLVRRVHISLGEKAERRLAHEQVIALVGVLIDADRKGIVERADIVLHLLLHANNPFCRTGDVL